MQDVVGGIGQSRKRKSGANQADSSFQFVNANPQSESERRDTRILIRANASKFHWRRVGKADGRSSTGRARTLLLRSKAAEAAHNSSAPLDEWDDVNVDDDQAHRGALVASRRRSTTGTRVIELLPGRIRNPLDRLGIGAVDPFEVYPSELPTRSPPMFRHSP
jgi:hypothetical protein